MESVQEILKECEHLYSLCASKERLDIYYARQRLDLCLSNLREEFEKDFYDEKLLSSLKRKCDKSAIYLEYVLSNYDSQLRSRYLDRVEIAELYKSIKDIVAQEEDDFKNKELIANMCCNLADCYKLLLKSQQLVFSLSSEDREMMELIQKQITAYKQLQRIVV